MDDERLNEIESRLAHQDLLLGDLDAALGNQQAQLMRLEQLCQSLIDRMRSITEASSSAAPGDERPPHY